MHPAINQAVEFLTTSTSQPPASAAVVTALLETERGAKQAKINYDYSQLLGTWRLGFITGTKKSRQQAGVILGTGRFLPRIVKIQLIYTADSTSPDKGNIANSVQTGPLQITLSGPVQFHSKNILAFDFTRMRAAVAGFKLYDGYIRQGKARETDFYQQTLKQQAFFTYFLIQESCIAARGKGGGLALWVR